MTPAALKAIRERAGLTQSGLAALFRINLRTLQFYEAGQHRIPGPVEYLAELLDAKRIP
jgi:DNA-binding transcriptional regulator YiaG